MGGVCLRAARIGLFLGCVGAAHHAYAIPRHSTQAPQVTQPPPPAVQAPILQQLSIEGATVYSRDDLLWLLGLRQGAPLTDSADAIARTLQDLYARDGYTEARVQAQLEDGHLTLRVDEGRIDEVELLGLAEDQAGDFRDRFAIRAGDIYNKRAVGQAVARLLARSGGAIEIGQPRDQQPGDGRQTSAPDEVVLEHRSGRAVLVVPLKWRKGHIGVRTGAADREDLFSPVDGFAPALGFTSTIFDHGKFNHTFIDGYASYKFGREDPGYSLGIERPFFGGPRLFVGAEMHDISATDDLWRLTTIEQTLVSVGFKNTFRDYYRSKGGQLFGTFQAGQNNELFVMARWDRHEPLTNATDFSFFRDDQPFRPNPLVADQNVNSWVLGYTFDTRPMSGSGQSSTYARHLHDSLFGFGLRQQPGLRLEWTSELADHGLGGDARFDRHIFNARGYLAFSDRQLFSGRATFGLSNGDLPLERQFSLGGIGTIHGYAFKEVSGTGMALMNGEYRVRLVRGSRGDHDMLAVFGFYDAGRISGPIDGTSTDWLTGVGGGVSIWSIRVEFGFRTNAIPQSRQILVRFGPTF
jgi:outer membrane protein assembly factor BamA